MTKALEAVGSEEVICYAPGFLLTPLGWAAQSIAGFIAADPALLADLFRLDRARVHLIGLALAHAEAGAAPEFGRLFLRGSLREVLTRTLGRCPAGMRRALSRMPFKVLAAESYRRLAELLVDEASAKLLFHAHHIDDSTIKLLYDLPAVLRRPALLALEGWFHGLEGLADGLRFLAMRGVAPTFEALVHELASTSQPEQFVAKLKQMVNRLPLPETMPPAKIGRSRRLDCPDEVESLAKRWRNCLANYVGSINGGECAVYLWEEADHPAACLARRHGRFGWLLDDVKGPRNADVEPKRLESICKAFAEHGIPRSSVVQAVENIFEHGSMRRRRRARRPDDEAMQQEAWDEDIALAELTNA